MAIAQPRGFARVLAKESEVQVLEGTELTVTKIAGVPPGDRQATGSERLLQQAGLARSGLTA